MPLNPAQKFALEAAKEITIAKLSTSASGISDEQIGVDIGEMYEAIYRKIYELRTAAESE